jgi:PAS domain S-box-containing protein
MTNPDLISVLYVDDEEALLDITSVFLKRMGKFHVDTANSAEAALIKLNTGSYDVIVSDYQMPETDGIDLLKLVRDRYQDLPFILFTGKGREEIVIEAINNGVDFYLQKGGDPRSQFAELAHKITKAAERLKAQNALRRSEENYRELVENANAIILRLDNSGRITFFNNYAQEFFGYSQAEIIGKPVLETIVPETETGTRRNLRTTVLEILHHPEHYRDHINENITRSGERVWVHWWNKPLLDEEGSFEGMLCIGNDITGQLRAEETVMRHKVLFDKSRDIIVVLRETDGRILDFNRTAVSVYGYSREELLNMTVFDFRYNENISIARGQMNKAAENGILFETVHRKKDGSVFPVEVSSFSEVMNNESIIISVIRDISGRKQVENALRQVNRKLNLLSSMTRHDILNQIMVLEGLFLLAGDNLKNPRKQAEIIEREKKITHNLQRQILFTRDYEHLGVKIPEWQKFITCMKQAAATLSFQEITWTETLDKVEIFADPLLEKVCYNLIDNSLRHGGSSLSRISLSAVEHTNHLIIAFEDNGRGIDESEKERLFERGAGRNTGLGLFLAREILAITGISIRETGRPGQGARFEIKIPAGTFRFISSVAEKQKHA